MGKMKMNIAAVLIFVVHLATASPPQQQKKCGLYGQAPCTFVPAPPGMTPKCASPGKTFCEHNMDYPTYLIKHLVEKMGYRRILANEERVDFNAHRQWEEEHYHHHYQHFYGPEVHGSGGYGPSARKPVTHEGYSYQQNDNTVAFDQRPPPQPVPQPIYIPKPQHSFNYNSYVRPPVVHKAPSGTASSGYFYPAPATQYSPAEWLKRFARDLSDKQSPRSLNHRPSQNAIHQTQFKFRPVFGTLMNDTVFHDQVARSRQKRQTVAGRAQLCQIREMYVTPQAALNTKGNWMYVVNHEDSRQLVKAEICSSTECSNLCNLPNGYNSMCEQKFSQKRLLTLDGDGQSLYVDTYWFPSCCVCTLAASN